MLNDAKLIDIITLGYSALEALTIRNTFEALNLQVRTHFITTSAQLISLFQDPHYLHPYIILSCHGDNEGIVLEELAPDLAAKMPFNRRITSKDLSTFINLNGQMVINTGCGMGREDFALSFINANLG